MKPTTFYFLNLATHFLILTGIVHAQNFGLYTGIEDYGTRNFADEEFQMQTYYNSSQVPRGRMEYQKAGEMYSRGDEDPGPARNPKFGQLKMEDGTAVNWKNSAPARLGFNGTLRHLDKLKTQGEWCDVRFQRHFSFQLDRLRRMIDNKPARQQSAHYQIRFGKYSAALKDGRAVCGN